MIFLVLPYNYHSGWGNCSINLAKQISKKQQIRYFSTEFDLNSGANPIESEFFKKYRLDNIEYLKNQNDYPIIQSLEHDLQPYQGYLKGSKKIGLCFSDRFIPEDLAQKARANFDYIIAGSEWSKNLLKKYGVESIVIHQGVDPFIFNKNHKKKEVFIDDFVVFSGGKFEHRKGQDVFIKAYKTFQDRHPDVRLVCAWVNSYTKNDGFKHLQEANIDLSRVIRIPLMMNNCMANIYQNTDVGVFPSRCEAGTNLVMMEYMACGKPAIATIGTGQADLLTPNNSRIIESLGACSLQENGKEISIWEEPSSESILENLEWAYNNRSKLSKLGTEGAKTMTQKTWAHMASSILDLID